MALDNRLREPSLNRLDQVLSHQKKDHAQVQELQRDLSLVRDELAAWTVYFQQREPGISGTPEPEQMPNIPVTVLTAMASKGDVKIEVTDPDQYPIGKYIVVQESFIYLVEGKGCLILDRPLCRDFLAGTTVRPLSDEDQYRWEDGKLFSVIHSHPILTMGDVEIIQTLMARTGMGELPIRLN